MNVGTYVPFTEGASKFTAQLFSQKQYFVHVITVLTTVTTKITVFWDVTPCSLVDICRRFG
jgi:hypothetical protein